VSELKALTSKIVAFRDARDWAQFHNPKDLALSLTLEATEVLELFQWQEGAAIGEVARTRKKDIAHELADVLYWTLLMANELGIDLVSALDEKLAINEKKYPAAKARGSNKKYTEL
jgi:dCTP diphosphatase